MGRGLLQGAGVNNDKQRWWFWIASYVRYSPSDASASKKPRPNISFTTPYLILTAPVPNPRACWSLVIYRATELSVYWMREKSSLATITTMISWWLRHDFARLEMLSMRKASTLVTVTILNPCGRAKPTRTFTQVTTPLWSKPSCNHLVRSCCLYDLVYFNVLPSIPNHLVKRSHKSYSHPLVRRSHDALWSHWFISVL